MKTNYNVLKFVAIALLITANSWGQATIAQWNFNGASASTVPGGTSNPIPSTGTGTLQLVGGVTVVTPANDFPSGAASGGSSDPVITTPNTNFAWGTTNYASPGTENKQRGIQINVSTVGYADITVRFDQRLSNKAGNTYVLQYTADRTTANPVWVDAQTFTFTPGTAIPGPATGDIWYNLRTADLSAFTEIDNNANAAFRIVGAFDPVAGDYLAANATSTYDGLGNARFDMVTVAAATTLSVSQFEANNKNLKVYPNPSNREVVTLSQTEDIIVSDVTGKVILESKNTATIDTRSFNRGVYFIKTASGATAKLMVN